MILCLIRFWLPNSNTCWNTVVQRHFTWLHTIAYYMTRRHVTGSQIKIWLHFLFYFSLYVYFVEWPQLFMSVRTQPNQVVTCTSWHGCFAAKSAALRARLRDWALVRVSENSGVTYTPYRSPYRQYKALLALLKISSCMAICLRGPGGSKPGVSCKLVW